MTVNTDAQALMDKAVNEFKAATLKYADWKQRVDSGWYAAKGVDPMTGTSWGRGLTAERQARDLLNETPAPPDPVPTATGKPYSELRLPPAGWGYETDHSRYDVHVSDVGTADLCAAAPGESLVYMDFFEAATFFTGISQQQAVAEGVSLGQEPSQTFGNVLLLDPRNPKTAQLLIANIDAYLTAHKLDGFYTDNLIADPRTLWGGGFPPGIPDAATWYNACLQLCKTVVTALRAKGYKCYANAIAFFSGNVGAFPGTDSNNGTTTIEWWKRIFAAAPFHGLIAEDWLFAGGQGLSGIGPEWWNNWTNRQSLVKLAQDAGGVFLATINYDNNVARGQYVMASMLLDWNGKGGGVMLMGGTGFNAAWCRVPGAPLEAKVPVGAGFRRRFQNLTAYINPATSGSVDFGGGVVLGPLSARIV